MLRVKENQEMIKKMKTDIKRLKDCNKYEHVDNKSFTPSSLNKTFILEIMETMLTFFVDFVSD